ncbi:hypothetical protein BOSE62_130582 [Bosea sp. 62]|nr:hypothetical protein BOSE7B_120601 [Bosea sp. 7B]CAD5275863.1 hypothetical protein BOSE21B_30310 [Bosea sp. 21B]CAD5276917.1 hypothetical protein BOSE46_30170 [Bosea sp. 46]VVT59949.1 hypothetical protein BOS5A_210740 [Bosea sp. EC-HK365B]VXB49225.1 hypothetical protein BOSE62_130582 [Bosea sp. 62]VXC11431.1 hypothetical protein BOSE127_170240 [Bosea sp. 127]VXC19708.1 hypothetical protein BOSE29B_30297 [Bosea sp. 29B]VXC72813.1 hypothetical protein BOSE125_40170 [Bosea sp. 125]
MAAGQVSTLISGTGCCARAMLAPSPISAPANAVASLIVLPLLVLSDRQVARRLSKSARVTICLSRSLAREARAGQPACPLLISDADHSGLE